MNRRELLGVGATLAAAGVFAGTESHAEGQSLHLRPFGTYRVFPGPSSQFKGPVAFRSSTRLDSATWKNDVLGDTRFLYGMGSYLHGSSGAHITIRAAMETADGVPFFFEYVSRGDMESHARGESPVVLAGFIEIDPSNERYAWLNHTHVVGRGMLRQAPTSQTYDMYALIT